MIIAFLPFYTKLSEKESGVYEDISETVRYLYRKESSAMIFSTYLRTLLLCFAASFPTFSIATSDIANNPKDVLNTVKEMALTICGDINPSIKEVKKNLSAEATAQTNSLFSSLVKGGVKVNGGFDVGEYYGVLRSDMKDDIKNNRDCRVKVVSDLSEKLLGITEKNWKAITT